jgi:hypothetical protein
MEGLPLVLAATFQAIEDLTATRLAKLAIASAKDPTVGPGRDGISYLINAKCCGIVTTLSEDYEKEILRLTGTATLEDARRMLTSS